MDFNEPTLWDLPEHSRRIKNIMLNYMHAKYRKKFVDLAFDFYGPNFSMSKMLCHVVGEDVNKSSAYVYCNTDRDLISFSDTYFSVIIKDELEEEIKNLCTFAGVEAKVFMEKGAKTFSNEFDFSKCLDDVRFDSSQPGFVVSIVANSSGVVDFKEASSVIFERIAKHGFRGVFSVNFVVDDLFKRVTVENKDELVVSANSEVVSDFVHSIK